MVNTHIVIISTAQNVFSGIDSLTMTNTHIIKSNCKIQSGIWNDIIKYESHSFNDATTAHNKVDGIHLAAMNDTHITNMTATCNGWRGIYLSASNNTHLTKITSTNNGNPLHSHLDFSIIRFP